MRPLVYSNSFTVRTDADLRAAIDAAAAREGASASDWVRRALEAVTRQGNPSSTPPFPARPAPPAPRPMAEGAEMQLEEADDLATYAPSEAVEPSALHAAVAQYRLEAFYALQHRHALNASILGIFEGAEFTVEQLAALVASHEAMTRRFGEALACLAAVVGSEGTA